jgi:hypothetical protein
MNYFSFQSKSLPSLYLQGNTKQILPEGDRKILAMLLVQLEETEEQLEALQESRADLLEQIASLQQRDLWGNPQQESDRLNAEICLATH